MAHCPRAQSGSSTLLRAPSTLLHVDSLAGSATSATSATSAMTISFRRPSLTSNTSSVPEVSSKKESTSQGTSESTPSTSRLSCEFVPLQAPAPSPSKLQAPAPNSKIQAPAQRHSLDRGPRLLKPPPEVGDSELGGGDGWEGAAHAKSFSHHRSARGFTAPMPGNQGGITPLHAAASAARRCTERHSVLACSDESSLSVEVAARPPLTLSRAGSADPGAVVVGLDSESALRSRRGLHGMRSETHRSSPPRLSAAAAGSNGIVGGRLDGDGNVLTSYKYNESDESGSPQPEFTGGGVGPRHLPRLSRSRRRSREGQFSSSPLKCSTGRREGHFSSSGLLHSSSVSNDQLVESSVVTSNVTLGE